MCVWGGGVGGRAIEDQSPKGRYLKIGQRIFLSSGEVG